MSAFTAKSGTGRFGGAKETQRLIVVEAGERQISTPMNDIHLKKNELLWVNLIIGIQVDDINRVL